MNDQANFNQAFNAWAEEFKVSSQYNEEETIRTRERLSTVDMCAPPTVERLHREDLRPYVLPIKKRFTICTEITS
jgi:hypothetical protein